MSADLTAGIVRILTPEGKTAGAGFVVTDDGLIATCAHVVKAAGAEPGDSVCVVFHAADEERQAQVVPDGWRDSDAKDAAILRIEGPLPHKVQLLPLGSSAGAKGRIFDTFGFPDAKPVEGMVGKCEVVGETTEHGFPVLQLRSSEVTVGFSGAPVWDDELHAIIGMVTSIAAQDQYGKQQETAFIIPVETLRSVCPALRLPEECPYRGLQVFEAEHADLYFGREAATRELLDVLSRQDVAVLVGVSGSGKSSLVQAGLAKGLAAWPVPGLVERPRCLAVPASNPLLSLALALRDVEGLTVADVTDAFHLPDDALSEGKRRQTAEKLNERCLRALADAVRACAPPEGLLLIVDQFERLYTECRDEAVCDRFIDTLLGAVGDRVKVLLALRADFYGLALEHSGLERVVKQGGQVTLGRMTEADLRGAIEEPAWAARRSLQRGLSERLISDVRERAGDLPLLEFALTELWGQDNQKGVLTLASYEALGYETSDGRCFAGMQGAIACRAEVVWRELDDQERQAARRVFLNLVTPKPSDGQGERLAEDAGRRAWQVEWDESTRRVVRKLVDVRLLTTGQDPVSNQPTVEMAHEALIRAWPRLQQWLVEYRPFARWYDTELAPFFRRWLDKDRHPDFLLPESMLVQSKHWMERYPEGLSGPLGAYIQCSLERREQERVARKQMRRWITLGLTAGLVVTIVLALIAWGQRNAALTAEATTEGQRLQAVIAQVTAEAEASCRATAEANALAAWAAAEARRQEAEEQRQIALAGQLAAQAQMVTGNTSVGAMRSVLLAVESLRRHPTLEGNQVLRRGISLLSTLVVQMEHGDYLWAVTFSPDGRWVASGGGDTARVWEVATGQEVARMEHGDTVRVVTFSPDGQWVASGSEDHTVVVWETATGQEVARMEHGNTVQAVVFSPDGRWVASGGEDNTARVWEAATGREVARMEHKDAVWAVVFSPDGRWVASGSGISYLDVDDRGDVRVRETGDVRVWEATTGEEVAQLEHEGRVLAVSFSPDGRWVASGAGSTVRVWDATTGQEMVRMKHEGGEVHEVVFSPDGRSVASVGHGGDTARVWDVATGWEVVRMQHEGPVEAVAFSPDGHWVASGSVEGTVRVWEATTGREVARMQGGFATEAVAFSPNGRWVVSGNGYGTVRVWDVTVGHAVVRMEHESLVEAVAFSPNGRWVVSGSWDHTVRVWDAATGQEVSRMQHERAVEAAAFSPDGRWVVSRSGDHTVRVWDAATGQEVSRMQHERPVEAVAFSPDGRRVASGGWSGTARVWEAATGQEVARMEHEGFVYDVDFSPDGRWLATGSRDERWLATGNTARVWEATTGQEVARMEHERTVEAVAFSPDGQWVASGGGDTARVWEAATGREVARMEHGDTVRVVTFSPDGQWVASGGDDNTVRVWKAATGEEVSRREHEWDVKAVAFSPDGQWVVSGDVENMAQVWGAATGAEVAWMRHEGDVMAVAFSPDGRWVASASEDHTVRVWLWKPEDLAEEACACMSRNLTLEEWKMYLGDDEPYHPTCPNLPVPEE